MTRTCHSRHSINSGRTSAHELVRGERVTLTVPELATLSGLHPLTIRRAIGAGKLKAANGGGRSHYRISRIDAEQWWRGRGGGTLLLEVPLVRATPQVRAKAILADLASNDLAVRNAAIIALASADEQTSRIVQRETEKSVASYHGPDDNFGDWRALDGESFLFPEEDVSWVPVRLNVAKSGA